VSAPSFSVVVCTYSPARWEDLVGAVESLRGQDLTPSRIVVAVDNDTDLQTRVATRMPDVTTVLNSGRRGLSTTRNAGVEASPEDVVAFLDDDAVADPAWLGRLARHYEDPRVLGVGGTVDAWWLAGRPRWFPDEFDWVVGCGFRGLPLEARPVRNFIGANMSFRREVFERIGGFREGIGRVGSRPTGCEETEFCIRAVDRMSGVLMYEPRAVVRHRVPPSRARWSYFWRRCWAEGLSKALVAGAHGRGPGLSAERAYTRRVLPKAVWSALGEAAARRSGPALARAGAIVGGLSVTTAGFVCGGGLARRRAC
jgi:GT2 family glycosyltransferase